jgi:hypothetical protein
VTYKILVPVVILVALATYSHVQPDLEEHVAEVLDTLLEPHLDGAR